MVKIHWHKYQFDNKKCYEGRVDGEIWYNITVHTVHNSICLVYAKYAGIDQSEIPVYYKFKNTNDIQFVKSVCHDDANSQDSKFLSKYEDTEYYELHERVSKIITDTDKLIDELRCLDKK